MTEEEARRRDEIRNRVIEQINEGIAKKNVTQSEIARAIGKPRNTVSTLISSPPYQLTSVLQQMADYLEIDLSWMEISKQARSGFLNTEDKKGKQMLDIAKFKEEIDHKLKASERDYDWLAEQTFTNKQALAMVLGRKAMKNRTPLLTEVSQIMGVNIPVIEEEPKIEPVQVEPEEIEETPTLIDDISPELEMKKEIWVDGRKYDEDIIRKLLEDGVAEHRKFVDIQCDLDVLTDEQEQLNNRYNTALEEIEKLQNELQTLTDKYIERDKEAIRLQAMVNTLNEEINELKQDNPTSLENMTIGEAVQQYRTLKRLFKDEVLQ